MGTVLMVDSGAYSAYTQKTKLDLGEYIDYIKRNKDTFEVYFNLDVLENKEKSYTNWVHMRAAGLDPIPVYHMSGTLEDKGDPFLKKYLKVTDYVAIGAIAKMSTEARIQSLDRLWRLYLTKSNGMPRVKVHGFGLTSLRVIKGYPWYSLDSTSWVMFGRYGAILVPKTFNGDYLYDENPFIVTVSSKSPKQKTLGAHFNTLDDNAQEAILRYIKDMGFDMGVDGLGEVHYLRDQINMLYYIGVQNSMPEWPWTWKPRRPEML